MYVAFLWNKARGESGDSYGESSRTPHIKGTLPLKQDCGETGVGRGTLELAYDLFPITGEFALPEAVTQTCMCHLVKQVVFLTVNHRGPLPLRELHSTDDTRVWRDPGGS